VGIDRFVIGPRSGYEAPRSDDPFHVDGRLHEPSGLVPDGGDESPFWPDRVARWAGWAGIGVMALVLVLPDPFFYPIFAVVLALLVARELAYRALGKGLGLNRFLVAFVAGWAILWAPLFILDSPPGWLPTAVAIASFLWTMVVAVWRQDSRP
jgi:hypothetical protein